MKTVDVVLGRCEVCVHGYSLGLVAGSLVACQPQCRIHPPDYCCSGFRRITLAEIDERADARFGTPSCAEPGRDDTTRDEAVEAARTGDATDSIAGLLEARHTAMLEWSDPCPARGPDGGDVDAHITSRATVHDCINLWRAAHHEDGSPTQVADDQRLIDFMAVNFADIVQPAAAAAAASASPTRAVADYVWPTIADYEKDIGYMVNDAFCRGWRSARMRTSQFRTPQADDRAQISGAEKEG